MEEYKCVKEISGELASFKQKAEPERTCALLVYASSHAHAHVQAHPPLGLLCLPALVQQRRRATRTSGARRRRARTARESPLSAAPGTALFATLRRKHRLAAHASHKCPPTPLPPHTLPAARGSNSNTPSYSRPTAASRASSNGTCNRACSPTADPLRRPHADPCCMAAQIHRPATRDRSEPRLWQGQAACARRCPQQRLRPAPWYATPPPLPRLASDALHRPVH